MLKKIHSLLFSPEPRPKQGKDNIISDILIEMSHKYTACKVIRWKDGTVYVGETLNDTMEGHGKLIFPNGDFYQGDFKKNHFQGSGKYIGEDGVYEGQWSMGLKWGCGKEMNRDGSSFTGKYQKGSKDGFGYFQWPDGSFYQGMFKQDCMQGPGKMVFIDGSQIEGEWDKSQLNGICQQTDSQGNIYIGTIKDGLRNGSGLLIKKNKKIEGFWKNDVLHGPALVQQNDGICLCIFSQQGESKLINDCEYQKIKDLTIS